MSFPTSGYNPVAVRYTVATEGSFGFNFTVSVPADMTEAEDLVDILDSALVTLAGSLGEISGITDVHVYKSITGSVPETDLA